MLQTVKNKIKFIFKSSKSSSHNSSAKMKLDLDEVDYLDNNLLE